jgi:DNA-binding transcriptional ArsR family regulator
MSLLPSRPDASPSDDAGPRVIGVDSEDADDVLSALSSGTARDLLAALHEEPAPPSELADRVDTSLQNAQYHLDKLQRAGAVEVVDTAYSAKGREMDVFAPADQPLVIFAGDEDEGSTLRTALRRLLGAVGVLALASAAVQALFGRENLLGGLFEGTGDGAAGGAGGGAPGGDGAESADGGGDGGGGGADGDGGDGGAPPDGGDDALTSATGGADGGNGAAAGDGGGVTTTAADGGADGGTAAPTATPDPGVTSTADPGQTPTPSPENVDAVRTTVEAAGGGGVPPGLVFFAGGLFVLAVLAVVLILRTR